MWTEILRTMTINKFNKKCVFRCKNNCLMVLDEFICIYIFYCDAIVLDEIGSFKEDLTLSICSIITIL